MYAAYMPFLKNGGIFVPTSKQYRIGDEIYLILSLMDDPNKYPLAGKVAWITPAGANNNKTQGIGLQFPEDESGLRVKQRIEEILGAALRSTRATHTL
jgi:type IV pilus assembly protein PilZ